MTGQTTAQGPLARIEETGLDARMVRAILKTLGGGAEALATLEDVARHGASGGFGGFIYHTETVSFFKRHRAAIVAAVKGLAGDIGEDPMAFVASFRCLAPADEERRESIARCLYGGRLRDDEDTDVANALTWFALEETARRLHPEL
jgi:hypothetical protein